MPEAPSLFTSRSNTYADGLVDDGNLQRAAHDANDAYESELLEPWPFETQIGFAVARPLATDAAKDTMTVASGLARFLIGESERCGEKLSADATIAMNASDSRRQAALLRDIFNPFQPLADASWFSDSVVALAQATYEGRAMPSGCLDNGRLGVLADALEEVGCTDQEILSHLREPQAVHARGCWAVDLLLGKS